MNQSAPARRKQGAAVAGSAGIALGRVQKIDHKQPFIHERQIGEEEVAEEIARLTSAIALSSDALEKEIIHFSDFPHAMEVVPILTAQHMMLNDPNLLETSAALIESKKINAEWALKQCIVDITNVFKTIDDDYLKSRREDVEHVGTRIFKFLMGEHPQPQAQDAIIVARTFSPLEIISMWRSGVQGFVSLQGGEHSHAMIVARGLGVVGLAGVQNFYDAVDDGSPLLIDAEKKLWTAFPQARDLDYCRQLQKRLDEEQQDLQQFVRGCTENEQRCRMPLMANLEFLEEVEIALNNGADGVGLFRTEYLFLQKQMMPDEEEQYRYYAELVEAMANKPVTFRLLDLGLEEIVMQEAAAVGSENPALGLRGVRLLLRKPELLLDQLRAIVRASRLGHVSILVPMVTYVSEMQQVRSMLEQVKKELGVSGPVALGCMIEVPAAALIAAELAKVSDFFSIGSNDLLQYSLAVDRMDMEVSTLYDASHQAMLELIKMTVDAALYHGIDVTVCGELAANTCWTKTFLDLRVSSLSMAPRSILSVRQQLHHLQAL